MVLFIISKIIRAQWPIKIHIQQLRYVANDSWLLYLAKQFFLIEISWKGVVNNWPLFHRLVLQYLLPYFISSLFIFLTSFTGFSLCKVFFAPHWLIFLLCNTLRVASASLYYIIACRTCCLSTVHWISSLGVVYNEFLCSSPVLHFPQAPLPLSFFHKRAAKNRLIGRITIKPFEITNNFQLKMIFTHTSHCLSPNSVCSFIVAEQTYGGSF